MVMEREGVVAVTIGEAEQVHGRQTGGSGRESLDEQVRRRGLTAITSADDLVCDGVFESDQELDEFLAYTYAARRAEFA
jgi:hypothetical protein